MNKQDILEQLESNLNQIQQCYGVRSISIFGSVARNEPTENSDLDVLVQFKGEANFDGFMDLKFYLEDLLEIKVDLVTDEALRPQIRQAVQQEMIHVA